MPSLVSDLSGRFIGTVIKNNVATRELAVYLPKLMPIISEETEISAMTNYGNSSLDFEYSPQTKSVGYIWVKASNIDDPLPKVGSKVLVWFLDGNPQLGLWDDFNVNGDYEIIDEEKYKRVGFINASLKDIQINEDDKINISLPKMLKATAVKDGKTITITINDEERILERLEAIEEFLATLDANKFGGGK